MSTGEHHESSRIAAANNAEWCASVWRSHGLTVERSDGLWFCRSETPRFYPNVVTVDPSSDPRTQVELIRDLSHNAEFEFSVKDSFARLPLRDAGFAHAFAATWLLKDLGVDAGEPQHGWRVIPGDELDEWEGAWAGDDPSARGVFRRSLLEDRRVTILGRTDDDGPIVAGAVLFELGGVAGLTNVFGAARGLFRAVSHWTSSGTLVAYEPGISEQESVRRGFRLLGPLTVWKRADPKVA